MAQPLILRVEETDNCGITKTFSSLVFQGGGLLKRHSKPQNKTFMLPESHVECWT